MTGADRSEPDLDDAYAVQTPEENRRLYARWADTYESGFIAESGYVYHRNIATLHAEASGTDSVQVDGPVLDVGCGTGVVGIELRRLGLDVVDGIDISPEMLAKAAAKRDDRGLVYRDLMEVDLTGAHDLPGPGYAGVVSAGAFTHGHLGPEVVLRLARNATSGTRFTIGVNRAHFVEHGFAARLQGLEQAGIIHAATLVPLPIYVDSDAADPDRTAQVAVFTVR